MNRMSEMQPGPLLEVHYPESAKVCSKFGCFDFLKTSIKFSFSHFTQDYLSEQNTIPHTLQLFETFKRPLDNKFHI